VPTVVKIHSLYQGQQGDFLYRNLIFPLASWLDRYMIRRADLVMTTSRFMKDSILRLVPVAPERVVAIDNGINPDWLTPTESRGRRNPKPHDEFTILSVGRLVPRKGTMQLVKAFREVHLKHSEARLVLVGSGYSEGAKYAGRLHSYIRAHRLQAVVRVVEWVPPDQVRRYYEAADLYVHAASYEPFGNVILEAMSVGLPVILVRAGGPEEVAGDHAVILENNQPAGLARAIESFIERPDKAARYSELSRVRARQFSWAKAAEATLARYRELVGTGH
jgi:glycosyltransferase involved in cell wall biosynthesis